MPKLRETETEREANLFRDWVRGECRRQHIKQGRIADELMISDVSMCRKLNGDVKISLEDVIRICSVLGGYTFGGNG